MTSCQHGKRSIRTNTRFCLKAETGVTLYEHESLIIFDEVQLFHKQGRQSNILWLTEATVIWKQLRTFTTDL